MPNVRTVLSYGQAVAAALAWSKHDALPSDATVKETADAYLERHKAHSRPLLNTASSS
jgi:hypothetical protein